MSKKFNQLYPGLLTCIQENFSGKNANDSIKDLWKIDRWFDFKHFKQSANFSAGKFQSAGLSQVEMIPFPADGQTCYGDWVVPTAWDAASAELNITSPQTFPLADYTSQPCSLAMWSAPTDPAGIEAEVVLLENQPKKTADQGMVNYPDVDLKGKILFSDLPGTEMKQIAARYGAPGIISDHHNAYGSANPPRPPDKISWINAWSDDPNGWPFTKRDTPTFGFSLSRAQGDGLRKILKNGQKVTASARVDTRLYDGTYDLVTGIIEGQNPNEEVMVFAHLYEQGAQDNAAGCAVVLESARCLADLIRRGKLPQPRRSIRFILSWEIYGLSGYTATRPDAAKRIIAGLNLDSLGVPPAISDAPLILHNNPHAQASYTDCLLQRIMEQQLPAGEWLQGPFDTTDSVVADPAVGIPMPWLGEMISNLWHSSLDTPEKIDEQRLASQGIVSAAYLYALANAGPLEMQWLAAEINREILQSPVLNQANPDQKHISCLNERGQQRLRSCSRLDSSVETTSLIKRYTDLLERKAISLYRQPVNRTSGDINMPKKGQVTPGEDRASRIVPVRKLAGGLSLGRLSPADWPAAMAVTSGQNPRWSALLCCALYWADGKRTLLEVKERLEQEFGSLNIDILEYFYFLEKHNYIHFKLAPEK